MILAGYVAHMARRGMRVVKMVLREIGWGGMDWIGVIQTSALLKW
jgi:hypothetical protein